MFNIYDTHLTPSAKKGKVNTFPIVVSKLTKFKPFKNISILLIYFFPVFIFRNFPQKFLINCICKQATTPAVTQTTPCTLVLPALLSKRQHTHKMHLLCLTNNTTGKHRRKQSQTCEVLLPDITNWCCIISSARHPSTPNFIFHTQ